MYGCLLPDIFSDIEQFFMKEARGNLRDSSDTCLHYTSNFSEAVQKLSISWFFRPSNCNLLDSELEL